ncbi:TetR/AcrR family transcriptional regulator [Streptomyces sp. CA2R106]|uniref:TetR/AcrR family transcriptional regulator n=1 Tax=Streptomyces sp. CA2R106 TaxID=3120153 RepID=UPI00300A3DE0
MPADPPVRPLKAAASSRADARRNRERILTAAREVFAASGLGTQMDEVAARAGVGLGTVYRHFPTKAALAGELIADSFDSMALTVQRAVDANESGRAALTEALREVLRFLEANAGARAAMADPAHTDAAEVSAALRTFLEKLDATLARAQADGTIRADVTAQDLGMALCGMSAAIDSRSYSGWERLLTLLLDGISLPPARTPLPSAARRAAPEGAAPRGR